MKENSGAIHAQVPVDVATYLLNEKRSDIHVIESRLKVEVVLIPNIHLETPNYTITRLRHDEINKSEPMPASYEMVEKPAEEAKTAIAAPESKADRPQAAVQGITPEQPAPVRQESHPSLIEKFFGWFKHMGEEKPMEATPGPRPQRRERRPEPSRGRRDHKESVRREGRESQSTRAGAAAESRAVRMRSAQIERSEGRAHQTPEESPQRRVQGAEAQAGIETKPAAPRNEQVAGSVEGRHRRGRRGGAKRERAESRSEIRASATGQAARETPPVSPAQTVEPRPQPQAVSAPSEVSSEIPLAAAQTAPEAATGVSDNPAMAKPEVIEVSPIVHQAETVQLPKAQPLLSETGATDVSEFKQIETDPEKARLKSATLEAESLTENLRPRPSRIRPAPPPLTEEPLVQIETRKDN